MKRVFPTSLALLLMLSSFGHVLAAAFCPHALGRECCAVKTSSHASSSSTSENPGLHHMRGMSMDGMNEDDLVRADTSVDHMAMNDMMIDEATVDVSIPFSRPALCEEGVENKFDQSVESCSHCLSHSGIVNAPVSFVSVSDQSGKEFGAVLLPVSRFPVRPAMASAQIWLPGQHAPPDRGVPRHILISVFLI
jgi:hypothetical protein